MDEGERKNGKRKEAGIVENVNFWNCYFYIYLRIGLKNLLVSGGAVYTCKGSHIEKIF